MTFDNNLIVVLALVVLAFLCLLIVIFIAALFMRITGRGIIPLLLSLREQFSESDPEDERRYAPKGHADLRSIAQQHDFNAALAQQVIEKQLEPPPPPPITPQNAPYVPGTIDAQSDPSYHTQPPTFIAPTAQSAAPPNPLPPSTPTPRFGHRVLSSDPKRQPSDRRRDEDDELGSDMLDFDNDGDADV